MSEPGLAAYAVVYGGALALVWAVARGKPLRPHATDPFRPVDAWTLLLYAMAGFLAYNAAAALVHTSAAARPALAWGAMASACAGAVYLGAWLRRVLRPHGSVPALVGKGLLVLWMSLPLVYGLRLLIVTYGGPEVQAPVKQLMERKDGHLALAVFAVTIAPLLEEIVFRGMLYPALRRKMGVRGAVIATSVLFGLIHVQPGVIAPLAVMGVFLAYLVETTGSLVPCIAMHAVFNALSVASLYAAG